MLYIFQPSRLLVIVLFPSHSHSHSCIFYFLFFHSIFLCFSSTSSITHPLIGSLLFSKPSGLYNSSFFSRVVCIPRGHSPPSIQLIPSNTTQAQFPHILTVELRFLGTRYHSHHISDLKHFTLTLFHYHLMQYTVLTPHPLPAV